MQCNCGGLFYIAIPKFTRYGTDNIWKMYICLECGMGRWEILESKWAIGPENGHDSKYADLKYAIEKYKWEVLDWKS